MADDYVFSDQELEIISSVYRSRTAAQIVELIEQRLKARTNPTTEQLSRYLLTSFGYVHRAALSPDGDAELFQFCMGYTDRSISQLIRLAEEEFGKHRLPSERTFYRFLKKYRQAGTETISEQEFLCRKDIVITWNQWTIIRSSIVKADIRVARARLSDLEFVNTVLRFMATETSWPGIDVEASSPLRYYRRLVRWKNNGLWQRIIDDLLSGGERVLAETFASIPIINRLQTRPTPSVQNCGESDG